MITILTDYSLKHQNTFRMNVSCKAWIEYTEASDIPDIVQTAIRGRHMSIGQGSNMLFTGDYDGALLHSRILDVEMTRESDDAVLVRAGAGVVLDELIDSLCAARLWGLENLSGIPGEVGASAVQNVGAYGIEVKDTIQSVECYDTVESRFVTLSNQDCGFAYRDSIFKHPQNKGRFIVSHVTYRLSPNGKPVLDYGRLRDRLAGCESVTPAMVRQEIIKVRAQKLPDVQEVGSAGSFFKNPIVNGEEYELFKQRVTGTFGPDVEFPHFNVPSGVKLSAAWLIDKAGLKGVSVGNAATWPTQPLVIVNATGKATPDEIISLEQMIVERVDNTFGIRLQPEVEHIR